MFDFEAFLRSSEKMLYTLAEVDELCVCHFVDLNLTGLQGENWRDKYRPRVACAVLTCQNRSSAISAC